ncbi:MAG: response regulator, partial [Bacteroidales bacterium]|nr:response regulator [Bacteroidales bacterium]
GVKNQVVSKLEESKDELEKSERKVRQFIDLSPIPIAIADANNNILSLNDQFVKIFGYTIEDMPMVDDWYPLAYPDKKYRENHIEIWKTHYTKALKTTKTLEPMESIVKCKNGEKKTIQLRSSLIGDNFIVLFMDLTKLRSLEADISYRIKMEEELLNAKQTAELANKAKSEFIASMSHEIRTPMNAILGFAEVLSHDLTDPVQIDYVNSLKTSGKTLLSLINDILDFSKIEAGKIELRYEAVNVRIIIQEISDLFKFKLKEKRIEFITDVDKNIISYLVLDELRIKQILINLVSNAIKFTEKGFIKISVKSSKVVNGLVRLKISVEDSGIGIAMKQQQKVFKIFEQMEGQDSRKFGGTGLGLAITTKLVSLMNGDISLESIVNKGSKFSVIFNDVQIAEDEGFDFDVSESIEKNAKFKKAKILVVDDIEDNRKVFELYLKKLNFSVVEAINGVDALQKIRDKKPDLIFMDINMPEMNGYETLQIIKEKPEWSKIPVVAVTAFTLDNDEKKLINSGFSAFVSKPFDFRKLKHVLEKYIEYETISDTSVDDEEETDFTEEIIKKLPELIKELDGKLIPILKKLENIRPKKVVNELAEIAVAVGEKYSITNLVKYGNDLRIAIKSFNVENEKDLILKIKTLINILQYKEKQ